MLPVTDHLSIDASRNLSLAMLFVGRNMARVFHPGHGFLEQQFMPEGVFPPRRKGVADLGFQPTKIPGGPQLGSPEKITELPAASHSGMAFRRFPGITFQAECQVADRTAHVRRRETNGPVDDAPPQVVGHDAAFPRVADHDIDSMVDPVPCQALGDSEKQAGVAA